MELLRNVFVAVGVFATVCFALFSFGLLTLMSVMSMIARIEREAEEQEDNWLALQEESIEVWDFKP